MSQTSFQVNGTGFLADANAAKTFTLQTFTLDDLVTSISEEQRNAALSQQDVTGRKGFKICRDGREAVWPPKVEAALINGLRAYAHQQKFQTVRHRGRFIGRNHFLARYIETRSGRFRTAKQVGSRLQQLKDTCREMELLFLITGHRIAPSPKSSRRRKNSSKPPAKLANKTISSRKSHRAAHTPESSPEPILPLTPQIYYSNEYVSSNLDAWVGANDSSACTTSYEPQSYSDYRFTPESVQPQSNWYTTNDSQPATLYNYPQQCEAQEWVYPVPQYPMDSQVPQWLGYHCPQPQVQPQYPYYDATYY